MTQKNMSPAKTPWFTYDHVNQTIVGSEFSFKKAGDSENPQYNALMTAIARHPNYTLAPIPSAKKVEKKQTYKGLTAELISEYVEIFGNEAQKAEHAQMVDDNENYPAIKSWFLDYFRVGFSVEKAKRDIAYRKLNAKKDTVRKVVKVRLAKSSTPVVDFPDATNF